MSSLCIARRHVPNVRLLGALVVVLLLSFGPAALGQRVILAGSDLWSTPGGGQTTHSFANDPIPAGFFGEGSDSFNGTVVLEGLPLRDNPALVPQGTNDLGTTDTIVRRLDDMSLQQTGDTASTAVEIVALSLKSVDPIVVNINGQETSFLVEVQLPSGGQQPQGQMTIHHNIFDGGTFDATVPVNADLFFVNASTGEFVGSLSTEIELTANNQPWLFFPFFGDDTPLVEITDPLQLGPIAFATIPPTSPNFHVGFTINPTTQLPKCVLSIEESLLIQHGLLPPRGTPGPDADGDGINDECDNCPETCNPLQEDEDKDCVGDACENGPGDPCGANIIVIPAGDDCWQTECGGGTSFDFCDDAIPGGFFGDGSDPFTDSVEFGAGNEGGPDTVVRRLEDMSFPDLSSGSADASTPIELVELSLVSCEPITVTFNDGKDSQQWDVAVTLSDVAPDLGSMNVTRTGDTGGTFSSNFNVQPLFTFTRVDDPTDIRTLDTGSAGSDPFSLSSGNSPWVHKVAFPTVAAPCGANFVPGVNQDPDTGAQCCFPICHLANVPAHHCVVVDVTCPCCETGACCLPAEGTCLVVEGAPPELCPEIVCLERGGIYLGDNTDCSDGDGDGLADILETGGSGDCCEFDTAETCDIGTDANNADSDGDGCSDGDEVAGGSDPCDECSAVAPCLVDCNQNGINDRCETDTDGDGKIDDCDPCPEVPNEDPTDSDGDGIPDACDPAPPPCIFGMLAFPIMLTGLLAMKLISRRRRS